MRPAVIEERNRYLAEHQRRFRMAANVVVLGQLRRAAATALRDAYKVGSASPATHWMCSCSSLGAATISDRPVRSASALRQSRLPGPQVRRDAVQ